ncbi:MAG: M20/M25/M40 family metallo-hydrolase [Romboutsia sp.]|uniref:M20/M25/M40 family metallo-hydrolase n=1 Tax=Romboutsia sp. TaxID=1965302 RepID=UPI003F2C8716
MINRERLVDSFLDMVKISSPSKNERKVADYILKELEKCEVEVYEDSCNEILESTSGNLIIRLKANNGSDKKVLLSAHMDTVNPCENVNPIIEDGVIKTDKTTILGADDKAGIANIIEMIRVINENNIEHPEVIIVFSVAEETGLHGAKNIDLSKFGKIDYGYILDAGGKPGSCYNQSPYSANGVLKIIGKEAHAGAEPENGINSFVVASEATCKLKIGRIDENTTCNIGIAKGGIATNVVMPELELHFEARSLEEVKLDALLENVNSVFEETCAKYNAEFINTVQKGTPGFNLSEESDTMKLFKKACDNLGFEYNAYPSGGGSDTNIYNINGIESVNIGIGMSNVHTKEEYIEIEDMINSTRLILELISVVG